MSRGLCHGGRGQSSIFPRHEKLSLEEVILERGQNELQRFQINVQMTRYQGVFQRAGNFSLAPAVADRMPYPRNLLSSQFVPPHATGNSEALVSSNLSMILQAYGRPA